MVKFGILGAGNIAQRFAASLSHVEGAKLVALSARNAEKGAAFAAEFGVDLSRVYTSHDDLLADADIDAIYLALPHALHHEWAITALRAGKAVLCEKPAMLTEVEMAEVAGVAREEGVLFMEAMKTRFVPLYAQLRDAAEKIGGVTRVEASLCNDMLGYVEGSSTYHLHGGPGAGALLDSGIYCACWIEDYCKGDPELVSFAGAQKDGVDIYIDARLAFDGSTARLETAFDRGKPRTVTLYGPKGRIEAAEVHRPTHATIYVDDKEPEVIDLPYEVDDFYGQICHFVGLVASGATESDVMPLDASVRCARILDAIRAAFTLTPDALDVLAEQERVLRYEDSFGSDEAFELGSAVRAIAGDYDLGYIIRITRESDGYELFGWGADGKKPANYDYAEGKRQASLRLGHASLWGWTQAQLDGTADELFSHGDMPVGGAFPIYVGDERVATLAVSGLHEGLDHELLVRGLSTVLGKEAPAFRWLTV